jgi:CRISPR-associated protein Csm1
MDKEKKSVILGALLHDIGKMKQRAGYEEDRGNTHVEIGYNWLVSQYGDCLIATAARNHHGNEPETWLSNISLVIYEADNLSASERKATYDPGTDTGKQWQREVCLANIFSRVRNPSPDGNGERPEGMTYIPLGRADAWNPPGDRHRENGDQRYRKQWEGFDSEFTALRRIGNHTNIDAVCHLLEKYASTVPAITLKVYSADRETEYMKHPDVSLFDHSKMTAAAASCMYDHFRATAGERWKNELLEKEITGKELGGTNAKPFLLVGGDISGIQRFIYTISSKGALRSLKGRSFYLELLVEHIVDRLLEETKSSRCNVIFTGGGHFYLLLPNTPAAETGIQSVGRNINAFLYRQFNAALEHFMIAVPFGKRDFNECTRCWRELTERLEAAKTRRWSDMAADLLAGGLMPDPSCLERGCEVCGREDLPLTALSAHDTEVLVCTPCREQYLLGSLLQNATVGTRRPVICRFDKRPPNEEGILIEDRFYAVMGWNRSQGKDALPEAASVVFHLNDWDLESYVHPASRPLLAGVYLPQAAPRDLEGMAIEGFGMARLGVLRMDLDNLGRVFSFSMEEGERTLSRMASLSRQLSLFFKYHLDRILSGHADYPAKLEVPERPGERLIGLVYSGGDDLFLIGHWLDVVEAGFDVRNAFSAFTANPFLTISGGMALGNVHDPVYRLADLAGEAGKKSKEKGKNSLTLFDQHTFRWDAADNVVTRLRDLTAMAVVKAKRLDLPEGSVSRGGLYSLLNLCRSHRRSASEIWILPKLAWFFGRHRVGEKYATQWARIKDYIFSKGERLDHWHVLEVAILWDLMMIRKEGKR